MSAYLSVFVFIVLAVRTVDTMTMLRDLPFDVIEPEDDMPLLVRPVKREHDTQV